MVKGRSVDTYSPPEVDKLAVFPYTRLTSFISRKFYLPKLPIPFRSHKIHDFAASFYVHSFACSCWTPYINHRIRCLSDWRHEHHYAWLGTGTITSSNGPVVSHPAQDNCIMKGMLNFRDPHKICVQQKQLHSVFTILHSELRNN